MKNLNIEKFNPTKIELTDLVNKYKGLDIKDVDDKVGYSLVDQARKDLKAKRVSLQKIGKDLRGDALVFQRAVIAKEKELISIIEPLEKDLKSKQDEIDLAKAREERRALLPERKNKLAEIIVVARDEDLLDMDEKEFDKFYDAKNREYLAEKERVLKEKEDKLKRDQEIEQIKVQAKIDAEKEAEKKRLDEISKREEDEKKRLMLAKNERRDMEANKKFKEFLASHGFKEGEDFHLERDGNKVTLYKKVGEVIL